MKDIRREIPSIDKLIKNSCFKEHPHKLVREILRNTTDKWREKMRKTGNNQQLTVNDLQKIIIQETLVELEKVGASCDTPNFKRVINATGVILNTNLGRAPISKPILKSFVQIGSSYSNLEFSLETGERGNRHSHIEELLKKLTGAEAGIVVNNNAFALLLILDTFAKGKEVIASRGELIEIGGSFRLPDILNKSGCKLIEVGTTNRTYIEDYEKSITKNTALLLKAHTSNYKIIGFTHTSSFKEIAALGKKHNILTVEDLGSGLLVDLQNIGARYGVSLPYEPTIQEAVKSGIDIVSFSGDKLLGGPQCGIIIGKEKYITLLKKNPLFRALRVGKFTLACLESILRIYLYEDAPVSKIPHLSMITEPVASVKKRAEKLYNKLSKTLGNVGAVREPPVLKLEESEAEIGGGAYPGVKIPSFAVTISLPDDRSGDLSLPEKENYSPDSIAKKLRECNPPIISRIANNKVWLDLKTIFEDDIDLIVECFKKLSRNSENSESMKNCN